MSDADTNFVTETFPGILHGTEYPSGHTIIVHPSEQWESRSVCNIVKHTVKKCFDTSNGVYLVLL